MREKYQWLYVYVTSESKKPRQIKIVIHYCDLSRFFDSDVIMYNTNCMDATYLNVQKP